MANICPAVPSNKPETGNGKKKFVRIIENGIKIVSNNTPQSVQEQRTFRFDRVVGPQHVFGERHLVDQTTRIDGHHFQVS